MPQELTKIDRKLVEEQLERILASRVFRLAARSRAFLRYVVEHSLEDAPPKEYSIATEVLGRESDYDPAVDATVRVEAGRLRNRLREYYDTEGKDDPIAIDIPKGGYAAVFTLRPANFQSEQPAGSGAVLAIPLAAQNNLAAEENAGSVKREPSYLHLRRLVAGIGIFAVLTLATTLFVIHARHVERPLSKVPIRIAIFPFANETGIAQNGPLAEGLTQNLIRQCSEISPLRVMSRAAVDNVTRSSAGSRLGVAALLTGTLRQNADGELTVDAELSATRDGSVLRSRRYIAEHGDLESVQAEIVEDVIDGLGIELDARSSTRGKRPTTTSPAAFQDFLRGEAAQRDVSPQSSHMAIASFTEAARKDPNFALAWVGLAESHAYLGLYFEPATEHMPMAREYARRALSLDPTLPEAHGILGLVYLLYDWNAAAAQRELTMMSARQVSIRRLACTAHLLGQTGELRHADEDIHAMLEFDPHSPSLIDELGCIHYYARDFGEAIRYSRRGLAENAHSPQGYWELGKSLAGAGRYQEALEVLRRFKALNGFEPPLITSEIGYTLGKSGDRRGAHAVARSLEQESEALWVDPYLDSLIYLGLGDRDNAYAWLGRAYATRSPFVISLSTEPKWDSWRGDTRFKALLQRLSDSKNHE